MSKHIVSPADPQKRETAIRETHPAFFKEHPQLLSLLVAFEKDNPGVFEDCPDFLAAFPAICNKLKNERNLPREITLDKRDLLLNGVHDDFFYEGGGSAWLPSKIRTIRINGVKVAHTEERYKEGKLKRYSTLAEPTIWNETLCGKERVVAYWKSTKGTPCRQVREYDPDTGENKKYIFKEEGNLLRLTVRKVVKNDAVYTSTGYGDDGKPISRLVSKSHYLEGGDRIRNELEPHRPYLYRGYEFKGDEAVLTQVQHAGEYFNAQGDFVRGRGRRRSPIARQATLDNKHILVEEWNEHVGGFDKRVTVEKRPRPEKKKRKHPELVC